MKKINRNAVKETITFDRKTDCARALGSLYARTARAQDVIDLITAAVERDPGDLNNWDYLAQAYSLAGQHIHGILIYLKLAREDQKNLQWRHALSKALRAHSIVKYESLYREAMLLCLEEERLSLDILYTPFTSLISLDPAHSLYKAAHTDDYDTFKKQTDPADVRQLQDPLFKKAISSFLLRDLQSEKALSNLRRFLLELAAPTPAAFAKYTDVYAAFAAQCSLNEYILDEAEKETLLIDALVARLAASSHWNEESAMIALMVAAYRPLAALADKTPLLSEENIKKNKDPHLAGILDEQVTEIRIERALEPGIPSLKMSDDDVSIKVRAMYEQNPYPRWKHAYSGNPLSPYVDLEALRKNTPDGTLEVLNAGCGTGRHLLVTSQQYPKANILAVDLSRASLSFAKKRIEKYALPNITLMQGDILELGALNRQFDIIESAGVLHHMKDPLQGWQVLTSLLKPGGYMRIALYSERARQSIIAARAFIDQHKFESTLEGIRDCRRAIAAQRHAGWTDPIITSPDYYSTSLCRDLIFHVQEHRYTIARIEKELAILGLNFVGFTVGSAKISQIYLSEYPADRKFANLQNWDAFEKKHPGAFSAMYQFWCRKPAQTPV